MSLNYCPKCGLNLELKAEKCNHCGFDLSQSKKESGLLQISDRVKTDADFPERWALKFGKKPKEKEDFQNFNEYEYHFQPNLFDPNYLHLKLVYFIEDLNYRIDVNKPPLRSTDKKDRGYNSTSNQDLDGEIKGTIQTSTDSPFPMKYGKLILGIILLLGGFALSISVIVFFTGSGLLVYGIILIAISIYFLYLFYKGSKNGRENGYINIYVLERGIIHSGWKKVKNKEINPAVFTKLPLTSSRIIISIATAVKLMGFDKPREDILKLSQKIEEFFQSYHKINSNEML